MEAAWPKRTDSMDRLARAEPPPVRASPLRRVLIMTAVALLAAGCVASPGVGAGAGSDKDKRPTLPPPSASAGATDKVELPPGLEGRAWFADTEPYGHWVAGRLGMPGRIDLADPEHPVAAKDNMLVSAIWASDGSTTLRFRDLSTGDLVREVKRPESLGAGAIVGDLLIPSNSDLPGQTTDPGLIAISLTDGSVRTLIEPGPAPAGFGGEADRTVIAGSSGRSIVSGYCSLGHCAIDFLDLASGDLHRVVPDTTDLYPGPSTDDVIIAASGDAKRLVAYDTASGRMLWSRDATEFQYGYMTTGGQLIQSYVPAEPFMFRVAVIDPKTNAERVLLERDPNENLTLWPELSTDEEAAIGIGGMLQSSADQRPVTLVRMLDLATGEFGHRTFPFRIND